jgi:hypothetical protein
MKYLALFIISLSMILSGSIASYPTEPDQSTETIKLRQRITELENRIKEMESTLSKYQMLEKSLNDSGYGGQNIKNWRRLETGMNAEQVRALLGDPIKTIDGVKKLWYYPDIYRGYVSFDDKGCVTGWHEP